ncbi:hypothetical protein ACQ4PT_002696 [Festuca glaucescens]
MAAALPDWMILERFVFYRDIAAFPDNDAAPFRADGTSSHDGSFSVALRIRDPPGISRLYLQWPSGPKGALRAFSIIAFNKYLCWVNYGGGGILFLSTSLLCFAKKKPPIFYLQLPILDRCLHYRSPALNETNHGVSVTRGSMGYEELRFIDIVRKDGNLIGPLGSGDMEGFTITCHALRITKSGAMEWDMLFFITCYELWTANPSLPHAPLKHPVVSMSDPNVVHFLMSEHLPQIIDKNFQSS